MLQIELNGRPEIVFVGTRVRVKGNSDVLTIKETNADADEFVTDNDVTWPANAIVEIVADEIPETVKMRKNRQNPQPFAERIKAAQAENDYNVYSALAEFNKNLDNFDKAQWHSNVKEAARNAITNVYDFLAGRDNVNGEDTIDNAIFLLLQAKELLRQGRDNR
jgi:hypothetical protein